LDPSYAEGKEGEQIQIKATVLPEDATNKTIEWSSSDESIATVDGSGLISVLKKGTAIITASATDGSGVSAECIVVVTEYSGIEDIMTDKNTYVKVFNLSGVLVYEGIYSDANLVPDYYIVVCDGKNVKVKVE
ncbi:MAG: Ig-like domain-containing protein, partial [Muribaculaceae bacterium]|nr:Ig-like domain-containing protein [Muribaculaceae bacterium]